MLLNTVRCMPGLYILALIYLYAPKVSEASSLLPRLLLLGSWWDQGRGDVPWQGTLPVSRLTLLAIDFQP